MLWGGEWHFGGRRKFVDVVWNANKVKCVVSVSDLALIGRVPISFPTPSTSTAIASQYLFAVLEHSFTCMRDIAQSFSITSKCF